MLNEVIHIHTVNTQLLKCPVHADFETEDPIEALVHFNNLNLPRDLDLQMETLLLSHPRQEGFNADFHGFSVEVSITTKEFSEP